MRSFAEYRTLAVAMWILSACSCPSTDRPLDTSAGRDLVQQDHGSRDSRIPDGRIPDTSVDLTLADLQPPIDATPDSPAFYPYKVDVVSDKAIGGWVLLARHCRWGTDHVFIGHTVFRRYSVTGALLVNVPLPKKVNGSKAFVGVGVPTAGKKGLVASMNDGVNYRFVLFSSNGVVKSSSVLGPAGMFGARAAVKTPAGFALLYNTFIGTGPTFLELRFADEDATLLGTPKKVANYGPWQISTHAGAFSFMMGTLQHFKHGTLVPDPKTPKLTLSDALSLPRNPTGPGGVAFVTTSTGVTWAGFDDWDPVKKEPFIAFNVEKGGKALVSPEGRISTNTKNGWTTLTGVATDDQRFLAIWGENVANSGSAWGKWVWKTQLFDLQGKPLAPVQNLALKVSDFGAIVATDYAMMINQIRWTGAEFEIFYNWTNGLANELHMARLKINKALP